MAAAFAAAQLMQQDRDNLVAAFGGARHGAVAAALRAVFAETAAFETATFDEATPPVASGAAAAAAPRVRRQAWAAAVAEHWAPTIAPALADAAAGAEMSLEEARRLFASIDAEVESAVPSAGSAASRTAAGAGSAGGTMSWSDFVAAVGRRLAAAGAMVPTEWLVVPAPVAGFVSASAAPMAASHAGSHRLGLTPAQRRKSAAELIEGK